MAAYVAMGSWFYCLCSITGSEPGINSSGSGFCFKMRLNLSTNFAAFFTPKKSDVHTRDDMSGIIRAGYIMNR